MKTQASSIPVETGKREPQNMAIGICWYAAQDWEHIKATAEDPELFEDSFSEWEAMAEKSFALIRTAYPNAVKVRVDPGEFELWCFLRGNKNNGEARSLFVADLLKRR